MKTSSVDSLVSAPHPRRVPLFWSGGRARCPALCPPHLLLRLPQHRLLETIGPFHSLIGTLALSEFLLVLKCLLSEFLCSPSVWNKWPIISVILCIVTVLRILPPGSLPPPLSSSSISHSLAGCVSVFLSLALSHTHLFTHTQSHWHRWRVRSRQQGHGPVTWETGVTSMGLPCPPPSHWKGNGFRCQSSLLIRFYLSSCWYR